MSKIKGMSFKDKTPKFCTFLKASLRAMVGTAEFVSPEVVSYEDIHTNTDMVKLKGLKTMNDDTF